jgi:capsular polysaccharide biosynthesis protein
MELMDAARRILWHFKLLMVFVAVGIIVPVILIATDDPTYIASTRIIVATGGDSGAGAADSVAAIATSETQIQSILGSTGIDRDVGSIAVRVSVRPIGTSGVVQLSVVDQYPGSAITLANALTGRVLEVMRSAGLAAGPLPYVVDTASVATTRVVPPKTVQDIALGGLAGLVIGLLVAALLEALNPTMVGEDAIAAEFGAPVFAVLRRSSSLDDDQLGWLRWQLRASARREHVKTVEMTSIDPSIDVLPLSEHLTTVSSTSRGSSDLLQVRALEPDRAPPASLNGYAGLVVVTPTTIKKAELERARDLLSVTGWPPIGVIAYQGSTGRKGRRDRFGWHPRARYSNRKTERSA